jgi:site-specific DNA recombinase
MKRVACYVRVSTDNQIENYSVEEQTERLQAYCKAKGWIIYKFYTDAGYSGGNMNRPALKQVLKDIDQNLLDIVVVYKLDRLSRSQKDTLTLIEDNFLKKNIDFVSISENFDTSTPFGRAMIGILSVFAQLEKDQITERFTMGRIGRAKNGYYHGGPTPPTGYDYHNGRLVINEYEAMQVREVFERFLKGQSINSIRAYMSEHYTNKYGNWKSHTLVLNILKNSTYTGKVKFKGSEYIGIHKPIISEKTYNSAQKLLNSPDRENSKTAPQKSPFRADNLLTGLLICGKCHAGFCGNHGFYTCYSRGKTDKKKIKDPYCKNKKWPIKELDKLVTDEILSFDFDKAFFVNKKNNSPLPDPDSINKRIAEIDKQISRIIDLYQIGSLSTEQISERIEILKKERNALSRQPVLKAKVNIEGDRDIFLLAKYLFTSGTLYEKRLFVRSLVDRITINDNELDFQWNFL